MPSARRFPPPWTIDEMGVIGDVFRWRIIIL
jgi:hypothetical protein